MGKTRLKILINTMENIAEAALIGQEEGSDTFIDLVRKTLAIQLKVKRSQLFGYGETLTSVLEKGNILPFKNQTLSFTPDEVNNWKPCDYQRINQILTEKANYIRQFLSKSENQKYFGNKPYYYVPKIFFHNNKDS